MKLLLEWLKELSPDFIPLISGTRMTSKRSFFFEWGVKKDLDTLVNVIFKGIAE